MSPWIPQKSKDPRNRVFRSRQNWCPKRSSTSFLEKKLEHFVERWNFSLFENMTFMSLYAGMRTHTLSDFGHVLVRKLRRTLDLSSRKRLGLNGLQPIQCCLELLRNLYRMAWNLKIFACGAFNSLNLIVIVLTVYWKVGITLLYTSACLIPFANVSRIKLFCDLVSNTISTC